MIKPRYIALLLLLSGCIFGLFQIKFRVQLLNAQVIECKQQLAREKSLIHVLKAEWAYLNKPERLQRLAEKFLDLAEIKPDQILISGKNGMTIANNSQLSENPQIIKASYRPDKVVKWRYKDRPDLKGRK